MTYDEFLILPAKEREAVREHVKNSHKKRSEREKVFALLDSNQWLMSAIANRTDFDFEADEPFIISGD